MIKFPKGPTNLTQFFLTQTNFDTIRLWSLINLTQKMFDPKFFLSKCYVGRIGETMSKVSGQLRVIIVTDTKPTWLNYVVNNLFYLY